MIELTNTTIKYLKEFSEDEGIGHTNIRIKCVGSGCAGLSGDIFFEDREPTEMDEVFEQDGIKIIIDCLSLGYMDNCIVDYISGEFGSGLKFVFKDEQIRSCGCGSSFSL